ncbi:hypothetical protein BYT27DRAFT_7247575 [Phlegmacium glaucopus]|nr:hypothetical protein BYT27DRAFT_7247575 [Phlegmacium glaucopus]
MSHTMLSIVFTIDMLLSIYHPFVPWLVIQQSNQSTIRISHRLAFDRILGPSFQERPLYGRINYISHYVQGFVIVCPPSPILPPVTQLRPPPFSFAHRHSTLPYLATITNIGSDELLVTSDVSVGLSQPGQKSSFLRDNKQIPSESDTEHCVLSSLSHLLFLLLLLPEPSTYSIFCSYSYSFSLRSHSDIANSLSHI